MNPLKILLLALASFSISCSSDNVEEPASLNPSADLSIFTISQGDLSPAFSNTVNTYTVDLKNRHDQISLNISSASQAAFTVNDAELQNNYLLNVGQNTFTVSVTSQDTKTQKNITLSVNRARQFAFVSNVDTGSPNDTISLYSINPSTGQLEPQPTSSLSVEDDPYDLLVSPKGDFLYVANAGSNTISQFSMDPTTGVLSPMTPATISTGTTPYAMAISSDDSSFYIPMGGGATPGVFYQYSIAAQTGNLSPLSPATLNTGNRPWFATITPNSQFVYLTIYNGFSDPNPDSIEMFSRDLITGALAPLSPPSITSGDKPWHINVHPNGEYIYNVNNGDATVSAYQINQSTGQLTELASSPFSTGNAPLGLSIDPQGRFLYVTNNSGNTVSMFSINSNDGALTSIGAGTVPASSPYGLEVDNSGRFLYVANSSSNTISMFSIDQITGALTPLTPSTVSTGTGPRFIRISH